MIFARDTPPNNLCAQFDPLEIGFIDRFDYGIRIWLSSRTPYRLLFADI